MKRTGIVSACALGLLLPGAAASAGQDPVYRLTGTVSSGSGANTLAIGAAQVTIYQAAKPGPRALASAVSDRDGRFDVRLKPDQDGGVLYAVARKGARVELMTLIGGGVPDRIVINEMTTVSSAYATIRLLKDGVIPAKPALPARVATQMARNLVSTSSGLPSKVIATSPNANETNAWALLGTLSNMLAPCVRGFDAQCSQLFALTTVGDETAPATTLQAIQSIARHPDANVGPLFDFAQSSAFYLPSLDAAHGPAAPNKLTRLDAFTLAVKVNATGTTDPKTGQQLCPFSGVGNFAFDTDGYAWITNNTVQGTPNSTDCLVVLKPNGAPADGTNGKPTSPVFGGGVLGQGFGVGFDPKGTVWSGNFGWGDLDPTDRRGKPGGSVSRFTRQGQPLSPDYGYTGKVYRVQGVVSDRQSNIWMASNGNNAVQVFADGVALPSSPVFQDENTLPFDVRLSNENEAWVSYNGTGAVSKFALVQQAGRPPKLEKRFTVSFGTPSPSNHPEHITEGPKGVAVDTLGNAWVGIQKGDEVHVVDRNGKPLGKGAYGGGGVKGPWGVSLDADQTVWVANFGPLGPTDMKFRISHLCGAVTENCPKGAKLGSPLSPATGYTLPSGGDGVRLQDGSPLYTTQRLNPAYDPMMRLTAVIVDMAGNVWCANNWKPSWAYDLAVAPGGDGVVIFIGLAAPVKPLLYSAPPVSPFAE